MGGVYKTDVFAMARWRNRRAVEEGGTGPIPVNVFVKPPSAELAPDQEDEKSLGVDYATLDRILVAYVEEGKDAAAIVAESGPEPRFSGLRHRPYRRQRLQACVGASVP